MGIFFDDNHDGIKDPGEDVILGFASPFSFGADYYYSTAGNSGSTHYSDSGTGGTNPPGDGTDDIVGAGQIVGPNRTFELRHPLCSPDAVHDVCLEPGDTVGVDVMYAIDGTGFMYPGADVFAPSDWADLTLEAAAPTGHIVFESNRDGQLEIYRMNADGSAQTRLTNDPATDNVPSISPDGTKVAFSSDREGSADIYVMNIDGTGLTRLTTDAGIELQPAWSPDGTKIAYYGSSIEQYDIFVVDAAGGTPVDVTNTAANEASASWSPDGTQLAFMSDRDGNEEVYRQNADGTEARDAADERARSRRGPGLVTRRAEDRLLQRAPRKLLLRDGLDDQRLGRLRCDEPDERLDLRRRPELVAGRVANRVRPRRRRAELRGLDGARGRDRPDQPDAHRRPELLPRLGAERGEPDRVDLDRSARELGSGRRLGRDQRHPARRDPRRVADDAGCTARRHPARRHPARRHPARRHPARRHSARRDRLHGRRTSTRTASAECRSRRSRSMLRRTRGRRTSRWTRSSRARRRRT